MDPAAVPADRVLVRPARPEDQPALAALLAPAGRAPQDAIWPPGHCVAVAVAACPPELVIGYGAWWRVRLDKFRTDLLVAPQWRREGAGGRLLAHIADRALDAGAATLQARVDGRDTQSLGFLVARGFVETTRMHGQVLQVAEASLTPHEPLLARLAGQGVVLVPLKPELARRPDGWEEFCRLYNAAREGWPDPDPGPVAPLTPPEFRRRYLESQDEHQVGDSECFLAVRSDRYVGFTGALGTAVDPAFRRQGIATALKLRAAISARDSNVATLRTNTGNPAMLRANERVGFRLVSTEIRLVRTLESR